MSKGKLRFWVTKDGGEDPVDSGRGLLWHTYKRPTKGGMDYYGHATLEKGEGFQFTPACFTGLVKPGRCIELVPGEPKR